MLALSSAWFKTGKSSLGDIFALLVGSGFRAFELNHVVHPVDLDELAGLRERYGFDIVSLHNVCSPLQQPLQPDDRYGDHLASLDELERRQSESHLMSTAEAALRLGAGAVVVHAGSVPAAKCDPQYEELRRACVSGELDSATATRAMRPRYIRRKEMAKPHLERLLKSLSAVCPRFPSLKFGLECRYHFYSLPDIDEMGYLLDALDLDNVGYWHDCGHAQVQENLGLCRHVEWLERYENRLMGVHLHGMGDVLHDHYAPAPGNMPYEMIGRYLRGDTILVLELAGFNDLDSITAGRDYLEALYITTETGVLRNP